MNLFDVILLLVLFATGALFWRIRSISEYANLYLKRYCEKENLQLISVARKTTKPTLYRGKLDWQSDFIFEFSATGDDCYQGVITMNGRTVIKTELPPHRMNSFH